MKNIFVFPRNRQGGELTLFAILLISLLLGSVSILGIFYGAITKSSEYNKFHRRALEENSGIKVKSRAIRRK